MRSSALSALAVCVAYAGLLVAPLATANAQAPIELEIGAPWEHPHSGIIVPDTIGGLPRGSATEFAQDFLNIGFSFSSDDGADEISLYIYRHTNGAVPVWFRQAQTAIETRDIYANPELAFAVEQYGWPDADEWQGLRAIYATPNSRYSAATAVVLFSVDGWLVKMRASSSSKTPAQLSAVIDAAFAELTPPDAKVAQSPAIAVVDCEEKLRFKKARDAAPDAGSAVLGALLGGMMSRERAKEDGGEEVSVPETAKVWCRDAALNPTQVAYRANGASDAYLLAISDSGMGISVGRDTTSAILKPERSSSKPNYSITLITDTQRINYVPQNRLPSLQRVLEVVNANRTVSRVSTWGDDTSIELESGALDN